MKKLITLLLIAITTIASAQEMKVEQLDVDSGYTVLLHNKIDGEFNETFYSNGIIIERLMFDDGVELIRIELIRDGVSQNIVSSIMNRGEVYNYGHKSDTYTLFTYNNELMYLEYNNKGFVLYYDEIDNEFTKYISGVLIAPTYN